MLRKWLLLVIIIFLTSPFGSYIQAESDINGDRPVSDMFPETTKDVEKDIKSNMDNPMAEENQPITETEPPQVESQFSWFDFVKMFFALGIVIALFYIILRFINNKNRFYGQMKAIENLGGLPLGTNRSIQLIRIGNKVLVVGVGETIQLLKEITSPDEIDQLTNQKDVAPLQVSQTILKKFLTKTESKSKNNSNSADSFSSMLKEQLEDLAEGRKKIYDKFKRDQDE